MAHQEQKEFCQSVKARFPDYFRDVFVVDIGSFDVNGNNQYLFDDSLYLGVDVAPGRNVDIVSAGGDLGFPDATFDVVISTECFEHDRYYDKTVQNICRMLKPGGLFVMTCATEGRAEHGTRRARSEDAPLLSQHGDWQDYYKNLTEEDVRKVIDVDGVFSSYEFSTNKASKDLYFWGVKRGSFHKREDYSFRISRLPLHKILSYADEIAGLKVEVSRLSKNCSDLTEELKQATSANNALTKENESLSGDIGEKNLLNARLEALNSFLSGLVEEGMNLRARVEAENHRLSAQLKEYAAVKIRMEEKNTALAAQIEEKQRLLANRNSQISGLKSEIELYHAKLRELEGRTRSSRWLYRRLLDTLIHAPRDISRRTRRSTKKRLEKSGVLNDVLNPHYRKYVSSIFFLKWKPVLPRATHDRMYRRMIKNADFRVRVKLEPCAASVERPSADVVKRFRFPNLTFLAYFQPKHRIAAVVHLYYVELWPEIEAHLQNIEEGYDLFVSLVEGASDHLASDIREAYPSAVVLVFPNHGRDVLPFTELLNSRVLDKYELTLKVHSKMSVHDVEAGRAWRQTLLDSLLGSPERVKQIIDAFRADSELGQVGPYDRIIGPGNVEWHLQNNEPGLLHLAKKTGVSFDRDTSQFIAGTMFWARPESFRSLLGCIHPADFAAEPLALDGTPGHAIERYFGVVAMASGYRIRPVEALQAPHVLGACRRLYPTGSFVG